MLKNLIFKRERESTIGGKYFHFCPSLDFPGGSDGKESACNAGDPGLIPGLGRSPGEGHGNPLRYSWTEEPGGL